MNISTLIINTMNTLYYFNTFILYNVILHIYLLTLLQLGLPLKFRPFEGRDFVWFTAVLLME